MERIGKQTGFNNLSETNKPPTFPNEIFYIIFEYSKVSDIRRMSLTCKNMHRISQDNSLWASLLKRDYPNNIPDQRLAKQQYRERYLYAHTSEPEIMLSMGKYTTKTIYQNVISKRSWYENCCENVRSFLSNDKLIFIEFFQNGPLIKEVDYASCEVLKTRPLLVLPYQGQREFVQSLEINHQNLIVCLLAKGKKWDISFLLLPTLKPTSQPLSPQLFPQLPLEKEEEIKVMIHVKIEGIDYLAMATSECRVIIFNAFDGKEHCRSDRLANNIFVYLARLVPIEIKGKLHLLLSTSSTQKIWNPKTGEVINVDILSSAQDTVVSIATTNFWNGYPILVFGYNSGRVIFWDPEQNMQLGQYCNYKEPVRQMSKLPFVIGECPIVACLTANNKINFFAYHSSCQYSESVFHETLELSTTAVAFNVIYKDKLPVLIVANQDGSLTRYEFKPSKGLLGWFSDQIHKISPFGAFSKY